MIYDCFLFSNELDLLELRLNELNDVVDRFILLESDHTISGEPKPLYFHDNIDRFKQFEDKIEHCIYDYPEETKDVIIPQCYIEKREAWVRESLSRDLIKDTLIDVQDDDIVIISDADEITSKEAILSYAESNVSEGRTLVQKLFYYRLNCYCPSYIWGWSKIVSGEIYNKMTPQQIRYARFPNIEVPGGWHFSFMGSPEMISNKIKAFAHQELNRPEFTDLDYIRKCMDTPKDIFNRPEIALQNVPIDTSFPEFVQNNMDKYIKMGLLYVQMDDKRGAR